MRDATRLSGINHPSRITSRITFSRLRFTSILLDPFMPTGVELELGRMSKLEGQRQRF